MIVVFRQFTKFWDRVVYPVPLSTSVIKSLVMVSIIFLLCNCTNGGNMEAETALKRIDTSFDKLLLDAVQIEYIDTTFKCIKLETKEHCFLGKVSKMKVFNEKLFLLDITSKALFCFDLEGKYVYKISCIGKGPGEYLNINDFDVAENKIILLDINGFKLIEYDLNGNFVKEKRLRRTALRALAIYDEKIYAYTISTPRQDETMKKNWIVVYDDDFKAMGKIEVPDLTPLSRFTGIPDYFIKKGDDLLFCKSYEELIFRLVNDELEPYLSMDFLRIPEETQSLKQLLKNPQAIFCSGRINAINDSVLFMQFGHNGRRYEMVYNEKKNVMHANAIESINSYTGGKTNNMMYLTLSNIRCSANDKLYSLCEVGNVKRKIKYLRGGRSFGTKDTVLTSLSDSIDRSDELQNPVVFCNAYHITKKQIIGSN